MKYNLTLLLLCTVVILQSSSSDALVAASEAGEKVGASAGKNSEEEPIKKREFITIWGLFKGKMWQLFLIIDYWGLLRKDWEYVCYVREYLKTLPVLNMFPNFMWYPITWYSLLCP